MRILVAIANYGTRNDGYLTRVIEEYRRMRHTVDIVVCTNVAKTLPDGIEVRVGLPNGNPWSLPFAHKQVLAERANDYDLFIYSEDDTLITERNIDAFLEATAVLPAHEIAGFLRKEAGPDGREYFSTVHSNFHWEPASVGVRGSEVFAFFTNEHAACYILTREQLQRAIASGGFLIAPHQEQYDLLVSAATDPYTRCGFRKMVSISRLEDFTVRHLPDKYVGRMGLEFSEFERLRNALLAIVRGERPLSKLLPTETRVPHGRWSKFYYEPCNKEMLALVPAGARNVLSVGCGWGATEGELVQRGIRVVGLPLDSVIANCAESRGVEILYGDLETALAKLAPERFDCILFANVLHLHPDPARVLQAYASLLSPEGSTLISTPNFAYAPYRLRELRRDPQFNGLGRYDCSGLHKTTLRTLRRWLGASGLTLDKSTYLIPERWQRWDRSTRGAFSALLGTELVASARKK